MYASNDAFYFLEAFYTDNLDVFFHLYALQSTLGHRYFMSSLCLHYISFYGQKLAEEFFLSHTDVTEMKRKHMCAIKNLNETDTIETNNSKLQYGRIKEVCRIETNA